MAFEPMNPTQSRRLALLLAVGALAALVALVGIPAWMMHRYYDASLADTSDKLDRYRRIAAMRPEVTRELEALRNKDTRRFFLRSGAAALSAAEAQEVVRTLIEVVEALPNNPPPVVVPPPAPSPKYK